eukprot:Seg25.8 transcript_id=Seg25.8/GoldUCD/mRNA.D3Y31 product="D-ribitol-5-phosphate cytidylyltransferase" protein_id=Seg25.8/GoldUCD/D3Y31
MEMTERVEESVDFRVDAVLPAGGVGERMGEKMPKQFLLICGRPLICYALDTFERTHWIKTVALPVAKEWRTYMENIIKEQGYTKIILSEGQRTRHRSIYEGIKSLRRNETKPDVVIIHDAVRPLVEETTLREVAVAARHYRASGAIRPLVSTIVVQDEFGMLDYSLVRSKCRASEMPQAFAYDVICEAYSKSTDDDFEFGTECLQLALTHTGTKAKLVDGPSSLWKVTYKKDIETLEKIIEGRTKRKIFVCKGISNIDSMYKEIIEELQRKEFQLTFVDNTRFHPKHEERQISLQDSIHSHLPDSKKILVCCLDESSIANLEAVKANFRLLEMTILLLFPRGCFVSDNAIDFIKQTRIYDMPSTVCGIAYCRYDELEMQSKTCKKIVDLVEFLVSSTCSSFHGQLFEF